MAQAYSGYRRRLDLPDRMEKDTCATLHIVPANSIAQSVQLFAKDAHGAQLSEDEMLGFYSHQL